MGHRKTDSPAFPAVPSRPMSYSRADIEERLYVKFGDLNRRQIEAVVRELFAEVLPELLSAGSVRVQGFGTFTRAFRPSRQARNPQTGEATLVPARFVPTFKAGKTLRAAVDEGLSAPVPLVGSPDTAVRS